MQILSERESEDILVLHPELIEQGLTLIERQAMLESRRTNLTFKEQDGLILLVELKKGEVTKGHVTLRSFPYNSCLSGQYIEPECYNRD